MLPSWVIFFQSSVLRLVRTSLHIPGALVYRFSHRYSDLQFNIGSRLSKEEVLLGSDTTRWFSIVLREESDSMKDLHDLPFLAQLRFIGN